MPTCIYGKRVLKENVDVKYINGCLEKQRPTLAHFECVGYFIF